MSIETWLAFFVACWIISLSPGAGAIASMSSGLNYGFARGYWTALGLQLGLVVQIAVVAAGVGAVLAASALAFTLIKWFGVLYLLHLAWRQWRAPTMQVDETQAPRALGQPLALVFRGLLINVSNPKAVVFMLAVLPQFQRQGVGTMLTNAGLGILRKRNCPFVIVVGHATYYPRFGFRRGSKLELACQWKNIPDESFMALILDQDAMDGVGGVSYFVGIP